jgi:hypothetical protein
VYLQKRRTRLLGLIEKLYDPSEETVERGYVPLTNNVVWVGGKGEGGNRSWEMREEEEEKGSWGKEKGSWRNGNRSVCEGYDF